jgi:hypothetical protein
MRRRRWQAYTPTMRAPRKAPMMLLGAFLNVLKLLTVCYDCMRVGYPLSIKLFPSCEQPELPQRRVHSTHCPNHVAIFEFRSHIWKMDRVLAKELASKRRECKRVSSVVRCNDDSLLKCLQAAANGPTKVRGSWHRKFPRIWSPLRA